MNEAMREADDLDPHDVDADARGRALVGPHGEHRRAQRAPAQHRDAGRDRHEHDEAHEPEVRRGNAFPVPIAEVDAEQLGLLDRLPARSDEVGVAEPERLDGVGEREGDDAEREAT